MHLPVSASNFLQLLALWGAIGTNPLQRVP